MKPVIRSCPCGASCDVGANFCGSCGAALPGARADSHGPAAGNVLGSYRLLEAIGSGGMGCVFVAEHTRLGRKVALKVLRAELAGNPEAVKRFFAEARAVNCINHDNIIEISDFVEDHQGTSFFIMELLKGDDLRALLDREGALPLRRTLRIAAQLCAGLGAAHDAGIIHRDLKPDNVFLIDRAGTKDFVKLLDFGVAKLMNETLDAASRVTSSAGLVVGTPDYMAPEQALGQEVDHRADIYSLGVILFEMVTGRRPFLADSVREVMVQHAMQPPPRPSLVATRVSVPPELERLVLDCLHKEPRDRPASMQDVAQRLREIMDELPRTGILAVTANSIRQLRGRRTLLPALAGVAIVALALFAGVAFAARRGVERWPVGALSRMVPAGALSWLGQPARREPAVDWAPPPPIAAAAPAAIPPPAPVEAAPEPAAPAPAAPSPPAPPPPASVVRHPPPRPAVRPSRLASAGRAAAAKLDRDIVLNPFE